MSNNSEKKLNGTVIVTYRCNALCVIVIKLLRNQRKKSVLKLLRNYPRCILQILRVGNHLFGMI